MRDWGTLHPGGGMPSPRLRMDQGGPWQEQHAAGMPAKDEHVARKEFE